MVSGDVCATDPIPLDPHRTPIKSERQCEPDEDTIFLSSYDTDFDLSPPRHPTPSNTHIQTRSRSMNATASSSSSLNTPTVVNYKANKRTYISAKRKLKMLDHLDGNHCTRRQMCDRLGVLESTLVSWIRNRALLVDAMHSPPSHSRIPLYAQLEDELLYWIDGAIEDDSCAVTGDILKQKANDIASDLGIADFNNNSRWILLFQTRHQIQLDSCTIKMEPSIRVNILRSLIDSDVDDPDEIGFIEIKQEIDEDSWTGIDLNYNRINENIRVQKRQSPDVYTENPSAAAAIKRENNAPSKFTYGLLQCLNEMPAVRSIATINLLESVLRESEGWSLERINQVTGSQPFS